MLDKLNLLLHQMLGYTLGLLKQNNLYDKDLEKAWEQINYFFEHEKFMDEEYLSYVKIEQV